MATGLTRGEEACGPYPRISRLVLLRRWSARRSPAICTLPSSRCPPDGWGEAFRFVALRYEKEPEEVEEKKAEQYQLFATSGYTVTGHDLSP